MEITLIDDAGDDEIPDASAIKRWAIAALGDEISFYEELNVRLVTPAISRELNHTYRGRDNATNVLSFPFEDPPGVESGIVGDLAICPQVVRREADEQEKTFEHHFAHMVIHGVLHLLGYDHESEEEAARMEAMETELLAQFSINNPYQNNHD